MTDRSHNDRSQRSGKALPGITLTSQPALAEGLQDVAEAVIHAYGGRVLLQVRVADGSTATMASAGAAPVLPGLASPTAPNQRRSWFRRARTGMPNADHAIVGLNGQLLGWLSLQPLRPPDGLLTALIGRAGLLIENAALSDHLSMQADKLFTTAEELRATKRAFRLAFDGSVVGMSTISLAADDAGRILSVNDALCRLTRHTASQLTSLRFTDLAHPADRALDESALRRALAGRRTPFGGERRYLRADGSELRVRTTAAPVFDDDGKPLFALAQIEDLSARRDPDLERAERQDPLTGLLNDVALDQALVEVSQRASRHDTGYAVFLAELDGWDDITAQYGADVTNELQAAIARTLQETMRDGDLISRTGDNQFVIVTEEVNAEGAEAIAQRLIAALNAPRTIAGHQIAVGASVGASLLSAQAPNTGVLLHQAKQALLRAKGKGGTHVLYSSYARIDPLVSTKRTLYAHPSWHQQPDP
ncbi:MAG: hypothetical protein QOK10_3603 [Pseudonocardiales bacterium]|jgi:diguanylate cyclase (GGDEF)-like protein/PAS domain S-box-containing protein|nr:hypothetical protein [Pseudonocardiales bacterium]